MTERGGKTLRKKEGGGEMGGFYGRAVTFMFL